jgi:hypothetical protein
LAILGVEETEAAHPTHTYPLVAESWSYVLPGIRKSSLILVDIKA